MSQHYTDQEMHEIAKRAREATIKELPAMTAFARAITNRRDIQVQITTGTPSTNGKTIWVRPLFSMGLKREHPNKLLCNKRDEFGIKVCGACADHEYSLATLFHEIGHNVAGSFDSCSDDDRVAIVGHVVRENAGASKHAPKIAKYVEANPNIGYAELSAFISPWFKRLVNILEDVRVNARMEEARPGVAVWRGAQENRILNTGVEMDDGQVQHYRDANDDYQFLAAIYLRGSHVAYDHELNSNVCEALEDETLTGLIDKAVTSKGVRGVYRLAFPILTRARQLGFLGRKDEPEDPPESKQGEGQEDQGQKADQADQDGSQGDADQADKDDQDGSQDGSQGDADQDGSQDGSQGDADQDGSQDGSQGDAGAGDDVGESGAEGNSAKGPASRADRPQGDDDDDIDHGGADGEIDWDAEDESYDDDASDDSDRAGAGNPADDEPENQPDDDLDRAMNKLMGHVDYVTPEGDPSDETQEGQAFIDALNRAEKQHDFDEPSSYVTGVAVQTHYGMLTRMNVGFASHEKLARMREDWHEAAAYGLDLDPASENVLGPALAHARVIMADNKKKHRSGNLRAGQVNVNALASRVPVGDERIFEKVRKPGRRDYFVLLGMDISGSTRGHRIKLIKESTLAMAEVMNRLGVKFAVAAHSGTSQRGGFYDDFNWEVDICMIKSPDQPWNDEARQRLADVLPGGCNLDGHTLEYYRKMLQKVHATDRILMYFNDGQMPNKNYHEELDILLREVALMKRDRMTLLGVGIGCDDPAQHGFDTVRLDVIEDIPIVVQHLRKRLEKM